MSCLALALACGARPASGQVDFPDDYREAYVDRHAYEVVPGLELAMIVVAVAFDDLEIRLDPVRRDTEYYAEVIEHFKPHAGHPLFAALDLKPGDQRAYTDLRNNSYNWTLRDGELERQDFLGKWWRGEEFTDSFAANIDLIRDFARQTDFAAFFEAHRDHYRELAALYDRQVDLEGMIAWLYANFPYTYESYRILFSPLMRGNQSTTIKRAEEFNQVFAIVDPPNPEADDANALMQFRWIFTELDHQYVDPAAIMHQERIDEVFADRSFWTSAKQSANYRTPLRVFAEYMTWAVFIVYVQDTYDAETSERLTGPYVTWMEEKRGFPRFGMFLDELLRLRAESDRPLQDLFPAFLEWAASVQE